MSRVWVKISWKKGDRHWWLVGANGMSVHAVLCAQVVVHPSGLWVFQAIAGPVMLGLGPFGKIADQQAKPEGEVQP